jgi:Spy/CpxP family protein refolding chaperone
MRRFARFTVPAVLVALMLGSGIALADSPKAVPAGVAGHGFQQRLGLTDDQMKAIRGIRERQRPAARQIHQSLAQANRDLRRLALTGADDATIHAKATEIEGLQGQALQLRVTGLREMAPLLNDDQKMKLQQMPDGRGHRGRHRPA